MSAATYCNMSPTGKQWESNGDKSPGESVHRRIPRRIHSPHPKVRGDILQYVANGKGPGIHTVRLHGGFDGIPNLGSNGDSPPENDSLLPWGPRRYIAICRQRGKQWESNGDKSPGEFDGGPVTVGAIPEDGGVCPCRIEATKWIKPKFGKDFGIVA